MINWNALFSATQPIPVHAVAAMAALVLGAIQFALPKGTLLHRVTGYVWVTLMGIVAISSLFIFELRLVGPFSPIHLLSLYVLFSLWYLVQTARLKQIKKHKRTVIQLYILGLIITGGFTFIPSRVMHQVVFGGV